MKPTKDAMMLQAPPEKDRTSEAYSEGGLSGEAALGVKLDVEPFMLLQRSDEELADYDKGFECGQSGGQNDDTKSDAWQRGWAEAQE
jgi:hypothetical protein